MSDFFFELVDSSTIRQWQKVRTYTKADLQADSADIDDLLALSNNEKELIISGSRIYKTVDDFDSKMELKQQKIDEIVNYWDYNTASTSFDRITGDYITPATVHSKCGEDATNVATRSCDGSTGNYWQHDINEAHWIIYDLGMSLSDIVNIGIALGPSDSNAHKLANVNVYVSDDANDFGAAVGSNLDFQTLNTWNSHSLTSKQGRYVKLDSINTLDTNNYLRIREVRVTHQIDW